MGHFVGRSASARFVNVSRLSGGDVLNEIDCQDVSLPSGGDVLNEINRQDRIERAAIEDH